LINTEGRDRVLGLENEIYRKSAKECISPFKTGEMNAALIEM